GRRVAGGSAQPPLVELPAAAGFVAGHQAIVRAGIEVGAVQDWRRHVRPAAFLAPGHLVVRFGRAFERQVAAGAGPDGVDRLDRPVAAGDIDQAIANDRRRHRDLRIRTEPPKLFAAEWIVATNIVGAVGNELGALPALVD